MVHAAALNIGESQHATDFPDYANELGKLEFIAYIEDMGRIYVPQRHFSSNSIGFHDKNSLSEGCFHCFRVLDGLHALALSTRWPRRISSRPPEPLACLGHLMLTSPHDVE